MQAKRGPEASSPVLLDDVLPRLQAAYHEAGHAVVAVATGHPLHASEISSDGTGWTPNRPGDSRVLLDFKKPDDRAYARRMALICFAGESAEGSFLASLLDQLALPPGNAPEFQAEAAKDDRDRAIDLVARLQWHEMHRVEPAAPAEAAERCEVPAALVIPVLKTLQQEVDAIVEANWPAVVAVAQALFQRGRLTGDEVRAIVRAHPASTLPASSRS
jgi:hypothetical protein